MKAGDKIEVRSVGFGGRLTPWIPAEVTHLDEPTGFFVNVDGPYGKMQGVWRGLADEGKYWRPTPQPSEGERG